MVTICCLEAFERRAIDICKVCSIEWDFIGKIEYFDEDYNYMFEQLGLLDIVGKRDENRETKAYSTFYQYFQGLGKEKVQALYEWYKPDFELFGYEIPEGLLD